MQTRREMLTQLGMVGTAGLAAGAGVMSLLAGPAWGSAKPNLKAGFPYPYVKLDPAEAAERGYRATYEGHCMYGIFTPIAEMLAEKLGAPWDAFPVDMFRYGAAGVMHWGSLCGAVNGGAAIIYLTSREPVPLIDELYNWYSQAPLPSWAPANPQRAIAPSVAGSPLCHSSVTRWCQSADAKFYSPERTDRCCRVVASAAAKTVELLNQQLAGQFRPGYALPAAVQECRACHGKGGMLENVNTKLDCSGCHTEPHPEV